jgi:hypothetical protein
MPRPNWVSRNSIASRISHISVKSGLTADEPALWLGHGAVARSAGASPFSVPCNDPEIRVRPIMMERLTILAIKAYSIDVAPLSSRKKLSICVFRIPYPIDGGGIDDGRLPMDRGQ